jgi:hypothetical protein
MRSSSNANSRGQKGKINLKRKPMLKIAGKRAAFRTVARRKGVKGGRKGVRDE